MQTKTLRVRVALNAAPMDAQSYAITLPRAPWESEFEEIKPRPESEPDRRVSMLNPKRPEPRKSAISNIVDEIKSVIQELMEEYNAEL